METEQAKQFALSLPKQPCPPNNCMVITGIPLITVLGDQEHEEYGRPWDPEYTQQSPILRFKHYIKWTSAFYNLAPLPFMKVLGVLSNGKYYRFMVSGFFA